MGYVTFLKGFPIYCIERVSGIIKEKNIYLDIFQQRIRQKVGLMLYNEYILNI